MRVLKVHGSTLDTESSHSAPVRHKVNLLHQLPIPIIRKRLLNLIARIHYEGAVLDNRFAYGFGSEHQKSSAFLPGMHLHAIPVGKHANGMECQWLRCFGDRADFGQALVKINEGAVPLRNRVVKMAARWEPDIQEQRLGAQSLDGSGYSPAFGLCGAGNDFYSASVVKGEQGKFLRLNILVRGRLHFFPGGQVDPQLETRASGRSPAAAFRNG